MNWRRLASRPISAYMKQVSCPFTWSAVLATTSVGVPLMHNEDVSQQLPDTGVSKFIIDGDIKIKSGSRKVWLVLSPATYHHYSRR
jgi:hypothetical protein